MSLTADDATLTQLTAQLEESCSVVAGAGTGKTHALVQRVLALLAGGRYRLRDLAIITFSNAAATELRERVRTELEDQLPDVDAARALDELDQATISTLHSFAQSILADHPLEAGLPPAFDVLDEMAESIAFDEWWRRTADELYGDPRLETALLTLTAVGVMPSKLREMARLLERDADRIDPGSPDPPPVGCLDDAAVERVVAALRAAAEHASDCTDPTDRLLQRVEQASALGRALPQLDPYERVQLLTETPRLRTHLGQKDCWANGKEGPLTALAAADEAIDAALRETVLPAAASVVARLAQAVLDAAAARRREGRLTFHDLLVCSRDLVARDASVRRALATRYPVLLLDEFQDTDPLQLELAVLIAAEDPDAAITDWRQVCVRKGALFIVGDPKQSIYRFRRADIATYSSVASCLAVAELPLVTSRRSRPGIVEWVNAAVAPLMREEDDPTLQARFEPLASVRPADPGVPVPVRVIGEIVDDALAEEVRRREAEILAAAVTEVVRDGWSVEGRAEPPRAARLGDIAVLVPTRGVLPHLERAFELADLPLRVESQSLLYATEEVQDLVTVLTAIDDPADPLAVVAALRAPAYGCSDRDLAEYADAGGRWSIFHPVPEPLDAEHPVVRALAHLRDLHQSAGRRTPSETVEAVIESRRVLEQALAHRRPRDRWRRIRYVADAARTFEAAGGRSLRELVTWLQDQRDERARVNEALVPEPDDDAVRVLTIHGSKGLEFPIVMLAGLGLATQSSYPPLRFGADGPVARVRLRGSWVADKDFDDIADRERKAEDAEKVRLLYVAATRARDHLVVSRMRSSKRADKTFAARLDQIDAAHPLPWTRWSPVPIGRATGPLPPEPVVAPVTPDDARRWWQDRQAAIERARRMARIAATDAAMHAAEAATPVTETGGEPGAPWRRGRAGTAVGRAVHAVLQTVDLRRPEVAGAVRAQAHAEGIPDREDEIRALVDAVVASPTLQAARALRCWREVPVQATVDGVRVEGYVDLLVERADGLVIVDYKTDAVRSAAEVDAAVARYRLQGAAYALALEEALGRPVAEMTFVFARGGRAAGGFEAVERTLPDLAASVAELRARLGDLAAPIHSTG